MKRETMFIEFSRAMVVGFCIAAVSCPQSVTACAGSRLQACASSPSPCLKSMSLAKSALTGMGLNGFPGGTVTLVFTLTATCPGCPTTPCALPATPTVASVSVDFYPGGSGSCPPSPPVGALAFSFSGPVATPACTAAGAFTNYTVVVPVPAATPLGFYCAYGKVTVTFSDGLTLSASGDTAVCIVAEAPGQPGVPRLGITLLSESAPRLAPGDVAVARYLVRNNTASTILLTAIASSRQSAVRPQGGNERQGVFAISNPFGDDFPIMFNPGTTCIPLPQHPYVQPALSNVFTVPAGGFTDITVGMRSYGQCADGSCSESTLRVSGTFSDGSPAFACAGMALIVDTSKPSDACARVVNDCNQNGIPDALDIANGRSQDRNYNALPDECEQSVSVPVSSSVSPNNPTPGAPIQVQVAFNENVDMSMSNVWANGSSLTRTQIFGVPFWQGTIPADTRPGPQTVYFLGKDQRGGLATYIATYTVRPLPRITRIYLDGSRNAILEHNGAQAGQSVFVQENTNLNCRTCWTNRPSGPHASPYNAGPAIATRFLRLAY